MPSGIYAAYFTGAAGHSFGLFVIGDGKITGVDAGGIKYDGVYSAAADGQTLSGTVDFILPEATGLITGFGSGSIPQRITVPLQITEEILSSGGTVRIDTPLGPLNARFEFLRSL